jgi:hypothetical protein
MTREEFTTRLQQVVYESSIRAVVNLLEHPPGKQPSQNRVALSEWFHQAPPADKERIQAVIRLAVRQATFGMLAVIDGVRAIADGTEGGPLELRYNSAGQSWPLNDSAGTALHDLFAEKVPPE